VSKNRHALNLVIIALAAILSLIALATAPHGHPKAETHTARGHR